MRNEQGELNVNIRVERWYSIWQTLCWLWRVVKDRCRRKDGTGGEGWGRGRWAHFFSLHPKSVLPFTATVNRLFDIKLLLANIFFMHLAQTILRPNFAGPLSHPFSSPWSVWECIRDACMLNWLTLLNIHICSLYISYFDARQFYNDLYW